MTAPAPARLAREENSAATARQLRRVLVHADVDDTAFARVLGVGRQLVQKWCSTEERHSIPLHDLLSAPKAVARELLQWVAEQHGLTVLPAQSASADPQDLRTLHSTLHAVATLTSSYSSALADGHVDAREARQLIADARACRHALAQLEHGAEAIVRREEAELRSSKR